MKQTIRSARPALWCLAALLACGCVGEAEDPDDSAAGDLQRLPTWEEFLAASTVHADGRELYIVEWDLPINTREELREYYDELVARRDAGEETKDGIGSSSSPLLLNRENGVDDVWTGNRPSHLRYCVSTAFAALHGRVVNEMARASTAWSRIANVGFVYVPAQNGTCSGTNTNIEIAVRPWNQQSGRAFFPHEVRGNLWMDYPYFDNNVVGGAPNVTTEGVLRHELGHILGFRHEQNAEPTGICFEDSDWRQLTEYDPGSVMHYPWCNGIISSDLSLTQRDERGAVAVYGMAIAPMLTVLGD